MPNTFAYVALFSYPLVVLILFRRMPREKALIWSILAGYLFLPERTEVDLPLLPAFDKVLIPSLAAAVMCLVTAERLPRGRGVPTQDRPGGMSKVINALIAAIFLIPIATYLSNTEPMVTGPRVIQGLRPYDVFSMMLAAGVTLLPFLLARRYLGTPQAARALLMALVVAGLVYSVFCLFELRMSPQLHRWVYGFHAHEFIQQVRGDGYRPTVFIGHGLRVAIFMALTTLAAVALFRARNADQLQSARAVSRRTDDRRAGRSWPFGLIAVWLFVILVLAKSLGALAIALLIVPVLFSAQPRLQLILAGSLAMAVMTYPMLRGADLVPVDRIHDWALSINEDRAASLKTRLDNETALLAKAAEKPVFGWGDWGRSRIYDERTGEDMSTTDGTWVIIFGNRGWAGYIAFFGLLCLPVIVMALRRDRYADDYIASGLALVLVANLLDLIPNSALTPVTWMLAGTLVGLHAHRKQQADATEPRRAGASRRQRIPTAPAPSPRGRRAASRRLSHPDTPRS